jgi:hypothetical protein
MEIKEMEEMMKIATQLEEANKKLEYAVQLMERIEGLIRDRAMMVV